MRTCTRLAVISLGCIVAGTAVIASDRPTAGLYRTECGSCHDAYPARLLGPSDWSRVLARLDGHYGVDASLDDAALRAVAQALGVTTLHPTTHTVPASTLPRITTSAWFIDEHDEVRAATFRSPGVRSAANCSACHVDADQGEFDEDSVRIPR